MSSLCVGAGPIASNQSRTSNIIPINHLSLGDQMFLDFMPLCTELQTTQLSVFVLVLHSGSLIEKI